MSGERIHIDLISQPQAEAEEAALEVGEAAKETTRQGEPKSSATIPTHGVMEGGGSYNLHAKIPAGGGNLALPYLETAARSCTLRSGSDPIVIADYGSSQGKNSLAPMRAAIRCLRTRVDSERPIIVVHVDQHANDFNTLFDVLHTDPERYSMKDPSVFPSAIGRSFYENVFPREQVDLGWCSYAAVWLSRVPALIPGHFMSLASTGDVRAAFDRQAADDWRLFLALRAQELRPGGRLVVVLPGLSDDGASGFEPLFNCANAVLAQLVHEQVIGDDERKRMVLGAYPRRRAQLLEPFSADGQFQSLSVERCELFDLPDAAWADYQLDGDVQVLVSRHAAFFRAIFVPSLASVVGDTDRRQAFADSLEQKLKQRLCERLTPFHSFVQVMVLTKHGFSVTPSVGATHEMKFENEALARDQVQPLRTFPAKRNASQIFYGWWVVLASAFGLFWGIPITVYSFSVFFKPLMQEFHAGRAAVSLAFTLKLIAAALCAAPIGWLTDRYGPRRVILIGTGFFGFILFANRIFSGSIAQFYCFYLLLGLCTGGVGPIPYGSLISHWFDKSRGLALGLTMLGIGLGAVIMPSVAQTLIARFAWRTAYSILGASVLFIGWPVVACFVKERTKDFVSVTGRASARTNGIEVARQGLTACEAWRSRDFWLMACAFTLVSASVQGCVVHLAPMLNDRNLGTRAAASGSSLIGAAVMIGRIGTGYLLDRTFAARLAAILFALSAIGITLLLRRDGTSAFAGAFLVGLGLGAEIDLIPYLASRYFGLQDFGKVYSSLFAAFALAGALGPLIMGAGFDRTGSYSGPLIGFFLAILFATVLMTRLGPYRFRPPEPTIALPKKNENCTQEIKIQTEKTCL